MNQTWVVPMLCPLLKFKYSNNIKFVDIDYAKNRSWIRNRITAGGIARMIENTLEGIS